MFRLLVEENDGSIREIDSRKGELPPELTEAHPTARYAAGACNGSSTTWQW